MFDVKDILEGRSDKEAAEELGAYFNRVSNEFDLIQEGDIPQAKPGGVQILERFEVASLVPWGPTKKRKKVRRINYTNELDMTVPDEPYHWTEAKWKAELADLLRYIDDGFCLSKICFENGVGFRVNGQLLESSMPYKCKMFLGTL